MSGWDREASIWLGLLVGVILTTVGITLFFTSPSPDLVCEPATTSTNLSTSG